MNIFKDDITNSAIDTFIIDATRKVITPPQICDNMFDLLDSTDFFVRPSKITKEYVNSHRVIDVYTQSGNFILACVRKFMITLAPFFNTAEERIEFIYKHLVFGLTPTKLGQSAIASKLYREFNIPNTCNIFLCNFVNDDLPEEIKDMKFDLVVGNPPYNNDMYLDFVIKGHELSKGYSLWITPAKWQTCADDYQQKSVHTIPEFRETIVPHISYVCFYPDALDLFNISQVDGLTYYLCSVDNKFSICKVKNVSVHNKTFNSEECRSILNRQTLYNNGYKIITKLGSYNPFKPSLVDITKKFKVIINSQFVISGCGSDERKRVKVGTKSGIFNSEGTIVAISKSEILTEQKKGAYSIAFSSDDEDDCINFKSWLDTKFVRFLIMCNVSKLTGIYTDDYWRFVPTPDAFDHIFTDDELYKKYNLTDEEISIIESVIKSR